MNENSSTAKYDLIREHASVVMEIQDMNPRIASLADEHITDPGEQGPASILDIAKRAVTTNTGVGNNRQEASIPNSSNDQKKAIQGT